MRKKILIFLCAVFFVSGCASLEFGKPFDPKAFDKWVEVGQTTQQQTKDFLGSPTSTGIVLEDDGKRYVRWLYYYGKGKISKLETADLRTLEIRFDAENKVISYNWSMAD